MDYTQEFIYLSDSDGENDMHDFPVNIRAVKDVDDNAWPLEDLSRGEWQAATVAKCTLPDGTPLVLKLHTEQGGMVLCFKLIAGTDYYY